MWTFIISTLLILALFGAGFSMYKRRKKGKSCGGCSGCSHCPYTPDECEQDASARKEPSPKE